MSEIVRLIRESLDPKLDPIEVSSRLDGAYQLFVEGGKQHIELPKNEAEQVLSLIAYGHVADSRSAGAFHSGADSAHSNPRLKRFQERFVHVAEMAGIEADWEQYLSNAGREYGNKFREPGKSGPLTIRSGRYGAPGK